MYNAKVINRRKAWSVGSDVSNPTQQIQARIISHLGQDSRRVVTLQCADGTTRTGSVLQLQKEGWVND